MISQEIFTWFDSSILRSDTVSQITLFSRDYFLRYYGGQLKIAVEREAGEKIGCKRW